MRCRHFLKLEKSFRADAVAFNQSQIAASKTGRRIRWPKPDNCPIADKPHPDKEHHAAQSNQQPANLKACGIGRAARASTDMKKINNCRGEQKAKV
jgi:hypothetical protein